MKSRPAQKKTNSYRKQWPDDNPFTSLWTLVRTDIQVTCALDLHVFWKILNHLQTRKIGNSYVKSPFDFFFFFIERKRYAPLHVFLGTFVQD